MKRVGEFAPIKGTKTGGSRTRSRLPEHQSDVCDSGRNKDLADWIMGLFTGIYGQDTMIRKYPNKVALNLGRRAYIRALNTLQPTQLQHGAKMLDQEPSRFPPTPAEFRALCIRAPEHRDFPPALEHKTDKEVSKQWLHKIRQNLSAKP